MTQKHIVEVSRLRLRVSLFTAVLGTCLLLAAISALILGIVFFPVGEKTLSVQPAFAGSFEASPPTASVMIDDWMPQEAFAQYTAVGSEVITVFIWDDRLLGYQIEDRGVSFGHREGVVPYLYDASGTVEVRGDLFIVPIERSTVLAVTFSVMAVVVFLVVLVFAVVFWILWHRRYQERRAWVLAQPA